MEIQKIREHKELAENAARWFHSKWGIPLSAYEDSIKECLEKREGVPQWYVAVAEGQIVAGAGVIENDFHRRRDLRPNLCALYVEEEYRCRGIAGSLLSYICEDMKNMGTDTLYLITDHTAFYERYGWEYLCMVEEEEGGETRMYIHKSQEAQP